MRTVPGLFNFHWLSRLSEVKIFVTDACMSNPVREGKIEAICYRRRLKIFENFLFFRFVGQLLEHPV